MVNIKKEVQKFLLGEEGNIAKESIIKLGAVALLASVTAVPAQAHTSFTFPDLKDGNLISQCKILEKNYCHTTLRERWCLYNGVDAADIDCKQIQDTTVLVPVSGTNVQLINPPKYINLHGSCWDHVNDSVGAPDDHFSCTDHVNTNSAAARAPNAYHSNSLQLAPSSTPVVNAIHSHNLINGKYVHATKLTHINYTGHASDHMSHVSSDHMNDDSHEWAGWS